MHGGNWEFWLNMTNLALGVITFAAVAVVIGSVAWELISRRARRARQAAGMDAELKSMLASAPDTRFVPGLGLTMADGGEQLKPSDTSESEEQSRKG